MEAPCAVPGRIGNASREVSRVHGTHTARRDVGPEPSGRLVLSAPPPSLRLVAGAHGCTRESEKPRLPFGPSKRREKRWKRRYTHAHARTHARRRAHSAANVRKGERGMRKCMRHHCAAAACRCRTLPPGGGPGGPPFGGPGGGPPGGAPLGGPRGGPGGGPVLCWRVVAWRRMASRLWVGAIYRG